MFRFDWETKKIALKFDQFDGFQFGAGLFGCENDWDCIGEAAFRLYGLDLRGLHFDSLRRLQFVPPFIGKG